MHDSLASRYGSNFGKPFFFPPLVALLIVLRTITPELFTRLRSGTATATDVMAYLKKLPGGAAIVWNRTGVIIEIGLLLADDNRERKELSFEKLREEAATEKASQKTGRASELLDAMRYFQNFNSSGPRLRSILDKIDLSSGLRD